MIQTALTAEQKLQALAYRFYQGAKWEPKPGDYYTSSRADLELYQVVDVRDGKVFTRYLVGSDVIAEWDASEFLAEHTFGRCRVFVPLWVLEASRSPVSQKEAVPVGCVTKDTVARLSKGHVGGSIYPAGILRPEEEVALYTSPAPAGEPAIKALEWRRSKLSDSLVAAHPFGENYVVTFRDDTCRTIGKNYPSLKAAQAAAQADYEARIRSAFHPTPTPAPVGVVEKWPEPGDKMQFLDRNGYDVELEAARKVFTKGQVVTVKKFDLGGWCSSITFEELSGKWNSVMFARSPAVEGK